MVRAQDVAAFILQRTGPVGAMKLQKLVYYSQAWHLALHGSPLFGERIQAWSYGPVVYELYSQHRRQFVVDHVDGDASALTDGQRAFIDRVLSYYAKYDGSQLSKMTHAEAPWLDARGGMPVSYTSEETITHDSMRAFYSRQPVPWLS